MAAALFKIALVVLSIFVGKRSGKRVTDEAERGPEPEAPNHEANEWARTLDLFFSVTVCGLFAYAVGALRIKPLESRGYDAIGELVVALMLLGVKGLFFVLLPAFFLYRLLRAFDGLVVRLVVYGVFAAIAAGAWYTDRRNAETGARIVADLKMREQREQELQLREAQTMAQARELAELKELEEHDDAVSRLVELTLQTHERWQADLRTAGAIGFERDLPPMLQIVDDGIHQKKVTNLAPRKVCVKITRAIRHPGSQDYLRCPQDRAGECVEIQRGGSAHLGVYPHATNEACRHGQLEYRVGTPLQPEPSWWSVSALADLEVSARDFEARYADMSTLDLRSEILRLEKMLEDTGRAERWKRELR